MIFFSHNDLPWKIRSYRKNKINGLKLSGSLGKDFPLSHTDIPRMKSGKVGAQVSKWSVTKLCQENSMGNQWFKSFLVCKYTVGFHARKLY